jgi:hypothetical protein
MPPSQSPDMAQSKTPGGGGTCCLNQVFYVCSSATAFQKCAGFDVGACYGACAATDTACFMSCDMKAQASGHDPSQCTHDPSRDGTCSTPPAGGCHNPSWNVCQIDADCNDTNQHCTNGKCYSNQSGSPCQIDADCGSGSHCTNGCCWDNRTGSPCQIDGDCGSGSSCVNGKCN